MPKKRMMINFDLDTNKYKDITNKSAPTAYNQLRKYMEKNGYIHRQGSCYISKQSTTRAEVLTDIKNFSANNQWFQECVKELDLTTIGKTLSIKYVTQTNENILNNIEQNNSKDFDINKQTMPTVKQQNEFDINLDIESSIDK